MANELRNTKRLILGNLNDDPSAGGIGAYTSEDGLKGGDVFIRAGKGSASNGEVKVIDADTGHAVSFDTSSLTANRKFQLPDSEGKVVLDSTISDHLEAYVTKAEMNSMMASVQASLAAVSKQNI